MVTIGVGGSEGVSVGMRMFARGVVMVVMLGGEGVGVDATAVIYLFLLK